MNTVWQWIKDRFKSKRTKTDTYTFLLVLASLGVIGFDLLDQIKAAIEAGQSLIDEGVSIFDMIRFTLVQFWSVVTAFVALVGALLSTRKREDNLAEFIYQEHKLDADEISQ